MNDWDFDDWHEPHYKNDWDEDDFDTHLSNCGMTRDGDCLLAGSEYCDWVCNIDWSDDDTDLSSEIDEVRDLGIEVTPEGFLLQREMVVHLDGSEHLIERILVIGCWDGKLPY